MNNQPDKIAVCGAGTMGSGIAQVCAMNGFDVVLYDIDEKSASAARAKIISDLELLTAKKKITAEECGSIIKKIRFTSDIKECVAGLIIEAVAEKIEIKAALFNTLAAINDASTIFATNTSSLSVTSLAEMVPGPERVAGMHFFNPAPVMKLVEVVRTKYTSDQTISSIINIATQCKKTAVVCSDSAGFIVNRVARPYYLEALYLMEHAGLTAEKIDRIMESCGFKMGPFRLMDLIGNDINYSVSAIVYEALGKPARLKPSSIQQEKVERGSLGRKTGKGYYEYPAK